MVEIELYEMSTSSGHLLLDRPLTVRMTPFARTLTGVSIYFNAVELDISGYANSRDDAINLIENEVEEAWDKVRSFYDPSLISGGGVASAFFAIANLKEAEEHKKYTDFLLGNAIEVDEEMYEKIMMSKYGAEEDEDFCADIDEINYAEEANITEISQLGLEQEIFNKVAERIDNDEKIKNKAAKAA